MGDRRLSQQISRKDWNNREPRVPGRDERASREAVVVLAAHPSIEMALSLGGGGKGRELEWSARSVAGAHRRVTPVTAMLNAWD